MEKILFQILIISLMIIQIIYSQSTEPVCSTKTSELSGTDDDDFVQIGCADGEVMTSCVSFGENDIAEGKRDGEKIMLENDGTASCRAFNGNNGKGVRAYARCCLWSNMECSYPFTPSNIGDMESYHQNSVTCPNNDIVVGCMAHSSFSCIRGASPGITAITISSISINVEQELNNNICRAYSCRSVSPTAACCRSPGLECHVRTSPRSTLATVNCKPGWIMTGCNVHTSNETSSIPMGSKIVNDVCSAYGTGDEGIWAVAVCCRAVNTATDSPRPTTSKTQSTVVTTNTPTSVITTKGLCETLETPTDAYTVGNSMAVYYTGDTITFDCQDGFERNSGDNERVCESKGQWTGTELECTKSGIYVPQYALFIAGGALSILVICFICLICYKRNQQKKEKPEEIYISSASSVRSVQSSVFRSPIYEELPQFALVKSKTLPARPPNLPHRCPSCNGERSSKHLHVPMIHSMSRPRSLPPDPSKHSTMYIKYSGKRSHLYDVPPIETHFDPNYELPKSDPPPPPPPGSKRPKSSSSTPERPSSQPAFSTELSTTSSTTANGSPGKKPPTASPRTHVPTDIALRHISQSALSTELLSSASSTTNGTLIDSIINPAYLPSPTEEESELLNGQLSSGVNIQVSEL